MSHKRTDRSAARGLKQRKAVRGPGNSQRASQLVTDWVGATALTGTDLALKLDREWFRSRPYRSHRLRRATPDELPGLSAEAYIVVRQVAPGVRMRCSFEPIASLPLGEAPEHIAHAMFDLIMESPGPLLSREELLLRSRTYEVAADPEDPSRNKPLHRH
jgi:hypothetical protein